MGFGYAGYVLAMGFCGGLFAMSVLIAVVLVRKGSAERRSANVRVTTVTVAAPADTTEPAGRSTSEQGTRHG